MWLMQVISKRLIFILMIFLNLFCIVILHHFLEAENKFLVDMYLCRATSNMLVNSISVVQTRTLKVLPYRRPLTVYSRKAYEKYLERKLKKRRRKIIKVPEIPTDKSFVSSQITSRNNLPSDLLALKYKKLRNIPGNVINRILNDMGTLRQRPNPHLCLLSNPQAINNALEVGDFVKTIYFNRLHKLKDFPIKQLKSVHLTHIPDRILKELPDSCRNGVFAVSVVQSVTLRKKVLATRRLAERKRLLKLVPLTIVCEGIKSKVEMGQILKYAESLGCSQVYVIEDCVDAWNTEVLDTAEGAHFKLPILTDVTWESLENLHSGENFFMTHFNKMGLSLGDFLSSGKLENYNRSSRVFNMLEIEGTDGTLSQSKEADFHLPPVDCQNTNMRVPGILVIGKASMDAFHYVANGQFSKCFALNLPSELLGSVSSQLEFILQQVEKQWQKS